CGGDCHVLRVKRRDRWTTVLAIPTTLGFWLLDETSGRAFLAGSGRGVYYGISFDADHLYLAARQAAYGAERSTQNNAVLVFDRQLRLARIIHAPTPIRDVHQIFCDHRSLWIASTYDDKIFEHDLADGGWNVWHPFGAADGRSSTATISTRSDGRRRNPARRNHAGRVVRALRSA
ncbi:MAG: hypothetical protein JO047_11025, partial [Alphaproteobacteria bacterium]|nr:hypothetical protein [Alphaproteobacteria bacterium]